MQMDTSADPAIGVKLRQRRHSRGLTLAALAEMADVSVGLLAAEARELNDAFAHYVRHRTPLVSLKIAATLDGAGIWGKFKAITIPLLTPTLFFAMVTGSTF